MIVLLNVLYGFLMVVIHMFIFRERSSIMGAMKVHAGQAGPGGVGGVTAAPAVIPGGDGGGITSRHKSNWYLQILDLDIAWAHGVLGLGDWYLCMLGLLYGILIIGFSIFVFHGVITYSRTAGVVTRWFMMFLHFELILYVALVLVKVPLLCKAKRHFLTLMNEDCSVLRFMFAERAMSRIILGALCCWVFSSFAYLLAWGDAAVDDPTLADGDLDQDRQRGRGGSHLATRPELGNRVYPLEEVRTGTRGSFDRVSHVGDPVAVSGSPYTNYAGAARYAGAASHVLPPVSGAGSFASAGRYAGAQQQQYIMPRASSSIQSNYTDVSQQERQMLIKPPIVIH